MPASDSSNQQTENQRSKGVRAAQCALPATKGKYIALCEGDDYWTDPDKIQKKYETMEAHLTVGLCVHPAKRVDVRNNSVKVWYKHSDSREVIAGEYAIDRMGQLASTASYSIRAEFTRYMPDWFFNSNAYTICGFFYRIPIGALGYPVHARRMFGLSSKFTRSRYTEQPEIK